MVGRDMMSRPTTMYAVQVLIVENGLFIKKSRNRLW